MTSVTQRTHAMTVCYTSDASRPRPLTWSASRPLMASGTPFPCPDSWNFHVAGVKRLSARKEHL